MCGFLAEFTFHQNKLTDAKLFTELLQLSKHRGPDSTLIHAEKNHQLGFNRLAILDLSENGNQPKYSPSKRYRIVFNGEIYNYKDLEKKHQLSNLQSTSDTEVLVHLLDRLGVEETLKSLNGMFAISIIDVQTNELYLARDFAGIKPLFYGVSEKGIVSASQFNQVFKHPWFNTDLQLRADIMKEYFGFGYMQAPNTIYKHIFQVKPGELLKISSNGKIEKSIFSKFNFFESNSNKDSFKATKEALKKSVSKQLVSDVPLATFLSGGIDSPLITAISKELHPSIEAFTVSVDDELLDETKEASAYAKHINIKHEIQHINQTDLLKHIDEHFKALPEPFGDYSSIPTYIISKKAKEKHTVMLSGDGGDELFYGYPRMLDVMNKKVWFRIPFSIRKPVLRILNKLNIINTWAPFHYESLNQWITEKHTHIFKSNLDAFFHNTKFSKELITLYNIEVSKHKTCLLQGLRQNEFYGHLQRVLIKVDRMSMANSLEVRVPFLDKYVIENALKFKPNHFKNNTDLKVLLKEIMADYFPQEIINQQKKGFAVPIVQWLHNELEDDVINVIFNKPFYGAHLVNVKDVKEYVNQFYNKKHDSAWGVWHIYAWQKWAISQGLI